MPVSRHPLATPPALLSLLPLAAALCAAGWVGAGVGWSGVGWGFGAVALWVALGAGILGAGRGAVRQLNARDLFSPNIGFPLAYVLWFTFGTLDFVEDSWHVMYGMFDPMPVTIWGYAALGLASYFGGTLLSSGRKSGLPVEEIADGGEGWPHRRCGDANGWLPSLQRAALAALFVFMLGSYALLAVRMGIPVLSSAAAEDRLAVGNFAPTQAVFLSSAWTLMVLLPASCWMRRLGAKPAAVGVATVSVLLLSMGGRGNFFIGCLTLLIASHYLRRRIGLGTLILASMGLFGGLSAYGFLRDSAFGNAGSFDYLEQIGIPAAVQPLVYGFVYVRGTVATFRDVTEIIPSEVPYQHGRLTFSPLSTLLPGHHAMADMYFKNILGHDFVGLGQPATALGSLYGDFGGWGIAAGMFSFGALAGVLYRRMLRRRSIAATLVYAWVMQTGLLGLFAGLFPYITALSIPLS